MISYDTVLQALTDAMEVQGPDFQYSGGTGMCYYVPQAVGTEDPRSRTGCLIGETMKLLGYPPAPNWEKANVEGLFQRKFIPIEDFEPRVVPLLADVQRRQDAGETWGQAIRNADVDIRLLRT